MFGIRKTIRKTPTLLLEGVIDAITNPPKRAIKVWGSLPEEDRELFKKAALSVARLTARTIIAAEKGKVEF